MTDASGQDGFATDVQFFMAELKELIAVGGDL